MATQPTLGTPSSDRGQVVRGPSPTDGIGKALRKVFNGDGIMPPLWVEHLRRLNETDY